MNALSFILLGIILILLSLYLYQRTKYIDLQKEQDKMRKRFIDLLRDKDEDLDKLEKKNS